MDEMGVFPRLAHHSTSAMKHRGNVLSSLSVSRYPLLFLYLLSHSTFPSIIPHFPLQCFPLSWPNYFSLRSALPAPWLSFFLYIVRYNFPSSFHIIFHIYLLLLSSTPVHMHILSSPFKPLSLSALPVCFYHLHI